MRCRACFTRKAIGSGLAYCTQCVCLVPDCTEKKYTNDKCIKHARCQYYGCTELKHDIYDHCVRHICMATVLPNNKRSLYLSYNCDHHCIRHKCRAHGCTYKAVNRNLCGNHVRCIKPSCHRVVSREERICSKHKCKIPNCSNTSGIGKTCYKHVCSCGNDCVPCRPDCYRYNAHRQCSRHHKCVLKCQVPACHEPRLTSIFNSNYCRSHTCKARLCFQFVVNNKAYCAKHGCSIHGESFPCSKCTIEAKRLALANLPVTAF